MPDGSVALVWLWLADDQRQMSTSAFSAHDLVDIETCLDQLALGGFEANKGVQLGLCCFPCHDVNIRNAKAYYGRPLYALP